jgi:pyruvate dehydrogenase E1 component beta subunit
VTTRELTYVKAFNEGMHQAMAADPDVFLIGEDVAGYGGVFHMFDGLLTEFGDKRVKDTPIAEQAIIGLGVGAAARGLRPVCDLMFMDFVGVAMDQIFNQAAKMKYMFGGGAVVPLTITTAGGGGMSAAAQHSQSLEAWLAHIPGLKVAMPASPYDAKGLIVVMNKKMLGVKGPVPEELYAIPMGQANIVREGSDITVVAIGRMVVEATKAAATLDAEGISVEIIDPRTVQPLDTPAIIASVKKTNRALVVHEAVGFGGIGAEISAQITEQAFDYLDAPVARVTAPFSPSPYAPILENAYMPDANRIAADIRAVFGRG